VLEALGFRDFRLLWSARLTSFLGDWLLVVAAPAYVFQLSHSLVAVGLMATAEFLPPLILGPSGGVLSDRWNRRKLMVSMDLLRVGAVSLFFLVHSANTVWIMYAAVVMESAAGVLFRPAAQALTPMVVGTGKALTGAASLNSLTDAIVRLAGPPLGAALALVGGFHLLAWLDMASYVASAALIAMVRGRYAGPHNEKLTLRRAGIMLADGARAIRRSPMARTLLPVSVMFLTANTSLGALLTPFGITHWGGERQVGLTISALGAGFLLGAPMIRAFSDRIQPRFMLGGALLGTAIAFFFLFHSDTLLEAMAAAVIIGLFGAQILTVPQVILQKVIPNEVLGRVSAAFFMGEALAMLVGSLEGPFVAQYAGYAWTTAIACSVTLAAGLLGLFVIPQIALETPVQASGGLTSSAQGRLRLPSRSAGSVRGDRSIGPRTQVRSSAGTVKRSRGNRPKSVLKAISPSSRASGAPMQK
jgi:MFS family permease